jgi:hypothetical protein
MVSRSAKSAFDRLRLPFNRCFPEPLICYTKSGLLTPFIISRNLGCVANNSRHTPRLNQRRTIQLIRFRWLLKGERLAQSATFLIFVTNSSCLLKNRLKQAICSVFTRLLLKSSANFNPITKSLASSDRENSY